MGLQWSQVIINGPRWSSDQNAEPSEVAARVREIPGHHNQGVPDGATLERVLTLPVLVKPTLPEDSWRLLDPVPCIGMNKSVRQHSHSSKSSIEDFMSPEWHSRSSRIPVEALVFVIGGRLAPLGSQAIPQKDRSLRKGSICPPTRSMNLELD